MWRRRAIERGSVSDLLKCNTQVPYVTYTASDSEDYYAISVVFIMVLLYIIFDVA